MPLKFKNISPRAHWWNYHSNSTYFITICTKDKTEYFGKIIDGTMTLSSIGKIVQEEWIIGPQVRPDMNLKLYEFVIMPDHFHALIEIGLNDYNKEASYGGNATGGFSGFNVFGPQSKNLGSLIRGFKASVTVKARKINPEFQWRKLYHDIIVKDETAFYNMQRYIKNNPKNWKEK